MKKINLIVKENDKNLRVDNFINKKEGEVSRTYIKNLILDKKFMQLAFDKAYEHLGSTKENPSVGCVVVKNNTVISSGKTSLNGRPHAETNALNKKKILMAQQFMSL